MPHISKKELNKERFQELYSQFVNSIHNLETKGDKNNFLWEFLTPTEKIMLSKRLAIILLLDRGESIYSIWNTLGVSSSTVIRIGKKLDRGAYLKVLRSIKKDPNIADFMEWLLSGGGIMPPYVRTKSTWKKYKSK